MTRVPRRTALAVAVLAPVLASVLSPAPAGAEPAATTTVGAVTLTAGDTKLTGTEITTLTVRVRLANPDGVTPVPGQYGDSPVDVQCPCLEIGTAGARPVTPTARNSRFVPLTLVSGTPQDGVWEGTTKLGAASAGIWRPRSIFTADLHTRPEDDPRFGRLVFPVVTPGLVESASLNVHGANWPVLTLAAPKTPKAWQPFVLKGTVKLSGPGAPARRLLLTVAGGQCNEAIAGVGYLLRPATTSSTGAWTASTRLRSDEWCLEYGRDAAGQPVARATVLDRAPVRAAVTAAPAKRSVAAGTNVAVNGRAWPANPQGVVLQRRVGKAWRVVNRARTGGSGTYSVTATPPGKGTYTYRVATSTIADLHVKAAIGKAFTITGR
ncbi:hypothetical protein [Motilibacter deserti]|uniref:Uncharacterized protein n=1 Tax=Motilibacter deserti TaxID=2714956 RepID=A0ABX0GYS5_9ACTN|nr:hypothetical protein [Motilibacter deserti]NHC15743.1 hypothetical protein [Motilibacter deserti]